MILYKGNKLDGKHEMTTQEIADSFIEHGNLSYENMEYYGLHQVIVFYISEQLGSWDAETDNARFMAEGHLITIYDTVKAHLKEQKLGLWGQKP